MGYPKNNPAFASIPQSEDGSRYFPETGHSITNGFLVTYETDENEARLGKPISQEFSDNGNVYQYFERGALSWNESDQTGFVSLGTLDAILQGVTHQRLDQPEGVAVYEPPEPEISSITGAAYAGERWIDINLSNYTITAFEGDVSVLSSLIVVGAAVSPTVAGEFNVYWKLESQDMEGVGYDGTPYQQDDVPWVMYFYQDWAIHGAYWRNGFGYAASHGCVNVPVDQAAILFSWASAGTRVSVHY
jgi:lipoprotein-anchoring transpeptidase ErfK/SrfK